MNTLTGLAIVVVGCVIGTILVAGLLGLLVSVVLKTVHWIFD